MSYRYIGNKTRLLPRLLPQLRKVAPAGATVADLMCGTGSVAEALRCSGYRVVASDIMTFAAHHARVRLLLAEAPPFAELGASSYEHVLRDLNALPPTPGLFVREYSPAGSPNGGQAPRSYFTVENAGRIDAITARIAAWQTERLLTVVEHSLLRHDLILAANRVANIAGTYGHFRSSWSNGSTGTLLLHPAELVPLFRTDHTVLQGRVEEVARGLSADVCYLDPPYMKRQYAANYHIPETLARGDEPEAVGVSGLRPWRDQYSDFCSKVRVRDAFAAIFNQMDCPHFFVSYSEDGLLSRDELLELFSRFGQTSVQSFAHQRFRSNESLLAPMLKEYLFHVRRT